MSDTSKLLSNLLEKFRRLDARLQRYETNEFSFIGGEHLALYVVNGVAITTGVIYTSADLRSGFGLPYNMKGIFGVLMGVATGVPATLCIATAGETPNDYSPSVGFTDIANEHRGLVMVPLSADGKVAITSIDNDINNVNLSVVGWWK